ncbi:hypothetical protein [Deferribacter abyssi]|uniref:hypothetical protein n=1 Tax=Deferribacter abyssi TaxID=213806 RepID=UPI003C22539F
MIQLTLDDVTRVVENIDNTVLYKYIYLQEKLMITDVTIDLEFQRKFNGFYRVRRNKVWQLHFYNILEQNKHNKKVSFADILFDLKEKTGKLEASFASKLVATINPDMPVIDKFVLKNTNLKLPNYKSNERAKKIIILYEQLQQVVNDFLSTGIGEFLVEKFQSKFLNLNISKVKMLDFVLWQIR